jgi:hypothetical protein
MPLFASRTDALRIVQVMPPMQVGLGGLPSNP